MKQLIERLRRTHISPCGEAADALESLVKVNDQHTETILWQAGRISELMDEMAKMREQEPMGVIVQYRERIFKYYQTDESPYLDNAIDHQEVYAAPGAQPSSETNGGKTGWPPGLLQDDCRALSNWLSERPGALQKLREIYSGAQP